MVRSTRCALALGLLSLCLAATTHARKPKTPDDGMPSAKDVAEKAREVYADLKGNSNPAVRRVVFTGLLALDKADKKAAVDMGLKESDEGIKRDAMGIVLAGRDRKAKARVTGMVQKLIESGEEADREQGYALLKAHFKDRAAIKAIQQAAKDGTPEARNAARAMLLARGGKLAWQIISAGLKEEDGTPEKTQAIEAFATFNEPLASKWALAQMHDATMGEMARNYLIRIKDPRASKRLDKTLLAAYGKEADYPSKVRIAQVLAGRGHVDKVGKTLRGGLRIKDAGVRLVAWQGLTHVRDLVAFGKLREKIQVNEKEDEAKLAYDWMEAWAKANAEPKVIELLQAVGRGDRRALRLRALGILTEIKHRASKPLFEEALAEGQSEVRLAGAKGIAAIAKPGDEAFIGKKLSREKDPAVRLALIDALANIGTPDIIKSLQFVITAPQPEVKLAAAKAVAKTGSPKAVTLLALNKRAPDLALRIVIWQSLLALKPDSLAEFKTGALSWLTTEHVEALGKDPRISLDVLAFIAADGSDEQRLYAVSALEARGEKAATRLLALAQNERNPDTAASALAALAKLRKSASMGTYRGALKSAHGEVRAAAYAAIGDHGPRALLETVLIGVADKDPFARAQATMAAVKLANKDS